MGFSHLASWFCNCETEAPTQQESHIFMQAPRLIVIMKLILKSY